MNYELFTFCTPATNVDMPRNFADDHIKTYYIKCENIRKPEYTKKCFVKITMIPIIAPKGLQIISLKIAITTNALHKIEYYKNRIFL